MQLLIYALKTANGHNRGLRDMSIDTYTGEHTGTCQECNFTGWMTHRDLCDDCWQAENNEDGNVEIVKDGDHETICPVCNEDLEYNTIDAGHLGDTDVATCDECGTSYAEGWIQPVDPWTAVNLDDLKSDYRAERLARKVVGQVHELFKPIIEDFKP